MGPTVLSDIYGRGLKNPTAFLLELPECNPSSPLRGGIKKVVNLYHS